MNYYPISIDKGESSLAFPPQGHRLRTVFASSGISAQVPSPKGRRRRFVLEIMALPSPATVFLHSIFDGVGCENSNVHPTLTMLVGEEEDVFALAFKEANPFSGSDVKPDVPRSQSMLFTNRTSEPLLDIASAHANYHISGPQCPSWQLVEVDWQLSSPAAETCQSKGTQSLSISITLVGNLISL